jgi:hypothetical protein
MMDVRTMINFFTDTIRFLKKVTFGITTSPKIERSHSNEEEGRLKEKEDALRWWIPLRRRRLSPT